MNLKQYISNYYHKKSSHISLNTFSGSSVFFFKLKMSGRLADMYCVNYFALPNISVDSSICKGA